MKALLKVDEEYQHLRHLKDHLRAEIAQNSHLQARNDYSFLGFLLPMYLMPQVQMGLA